MRSRSMNPFSTALSTAEQTPQFPEPTSVRTPPAAEQGGLFKLLGNLQTEDYILIGMIAVLFFEGCDDYILMAALGYLFLMGIL